MKIGAGADPSERSQIVLKISDQLSLPSDAATQTFAFLGRKGSGKTYASGKLVELLLEAGVQVVILDPVGNWYGLRLTSDGKRPAFDVPVFGGLRGDLPLQASAGELIADIVVDTGRSLIVDISQFSLEDRKRFATSFGQRLWLKRKADLHQAPMMLVIEESQLIIPQDVRGDAAKMVGIYEEIIRLGRNFSIGATMISQRPQSVNKEVLNQTECLFVLQTNGPQERKALKNWVVHHGSDVKLIDELPSLPVGTAYVWSPQWLQTFKKIQIAKKVSLDSTGTVKIGQKQVRRNPAPLDLKEIEQRMSAIVEQAKANDPKELRKKILDLTKQVQGLEKKLAERPEAKPVEKIKTVPVLKDGHLDRIEKLLHNIETITGKFNTQMMGLRLLIAPAIPDQTPTQQRPASPQRIPPRTTSPSRPPAKRPAPSSREGSSDISAAGQKILDALAWWEMVGRQVVDKQSAAFAAGYTVNGHFTNTLGNLRTNGLVDYPEGGSVALTDAGRSTANYPEAAGTLEDLHIAIRRKLNTAQQRIIDVVIDNHPRELPKEQVAELAGYTVNGHFTNTLGSLRTLGLITKRGDIGATDVLFPEALT